MNIPESEQVAGEKTASKRQKKTSWLQNHFFLGSLMFWDDLHTVPRRLSFVEDRQTKIRVPFAENTSLEQKFPTLDNSVALM